MEFAGRHLYQRSFPGYIGEGATIKAFLDAEGHGASRSSITRERHAWGVKSS